MLVLQDDITLPARSILIVTRLSRSNKRRRAVNPVIDIAFPGHSIKQGSTRVCHSHAL